MNFESLKKLFGAPPPLPPKNKNKRWPEMYKFKIDWISI